MDIDEFMKNNSVKSKKNVMKWVDEGLIPGTKVSKDGELIFSKYARAPYTATRAKTTGAIYKSIIKGCYQRKGVCAKLYGIPEEEFDIYIEYAQQEQLIEVKTDGNCKFYFATPKCEEFLKKPKIPSALIDIISSIAIKGATELLNKDM